jgi:hypothetical protein
MLGEVNRILIASDHDIGSSIGDNVINGVGSCYEDDVELTCNNFGSDVDNEEVIIAFTAPYTGTFQFDTNGSVGDTVMAVYDESGSNMIDCDDDNGDGLDSLLIVSLTECATYLIAIEDFGTDNCENLSWVLNIHEAV